MKRSEMKEIRTSILACGEVGGPRRAHYRVLFDLRLGRIDVSTSPGKSKETGFLEAEGILQFSFPSPMPKYPSQGSLLWGVPRSPPLGLQLCSVPIS